MGACCTLSVGWLDNEYWDILTLYQPDVLLSSYVQFNVLRMTCTMHGSKADYMSRNEGAWR